MTRSTKLFCQRETWGPVYGGRVKFRGTSREEPILRSGRQLTKHPATEGHPDGQCATGRDYGDRDTYGKSIFTGGPVQVKGSHPQEMFPSRARLNSSSKEDKQEANKRKLVPK